MPEKFTTEAAAKVDDRPAPGQDATAAAETKAKSEKEILEEMQQLRLLTMKTITELSATYTNELQSKMDRLDKIIGRDHWLSVGEYKESIIRQQLQQKVPRKFEVGTGFVLAIHNNQIIKSLQLDIMVWDSLNYAPFFRDGDFVIVPPEACRAVISVKSNLTNKSLKEALKNIDSLSKFFPMARMNNMLYTSVFAFDCKGGKAFPSSIFTGVESYYRSANADINFEERLKFMSQYGRQPQTGWVDNICVLKKGVIAFSLGW